MYLFQNAGAWCARFIPALILSLSIPVTSHALKPQKQDYDKSLIGTFVENNTLKIVGYDAFLQEYLYEATKEYYSNFTYDWSPDGVIGHDNVSTIVTSKLTDRATDKFQIYALLKEIYSNPEIPGYRHDVMFDENDPLYSADNGSYILTNQGGISTGATDIYETDSWNNVVLDSNGQPKPSAKASKALRADFAEVKYPSFNLYPYFIEPTNTVTGEIERPLNGATALLVELTDEYRFFNEKINPETGLTEIEYLKSDVCGNFSKFKDKGREAFMDAIFKYVKAITVIPTQLYINEVESNGNPGYIFNIDASISKCFIMTKGCNRAMKSFQRQGEGNGSFYAGEPFYNMFEEYSANNNGPQVNAFADMNAGKAFEVDHNCGTGLQQQHDIVFPATVTDPTVYNVNLMLFLPDRRFMGKTCIHPTDDATLSDDPANGKFRRTNSTYTPYTFYSKDHRPYIYFNKIIAYIEVPYLDESSVVKNEDNKTVEATAKVPLNWESQYNRIVGHQAPETFKIFRVVNGNMEENPIPLEYIIVDGSRTDGEVSKNSDGVSLTSDAGTIFVEIIETLVDASTDLDRLGNEVSYIVMGHRDGNDNFIDVSSNIITAHLPGNDITLRLKKAQSKGHYYDHQNEYINTVEIVYNGYTTNPDGTVNEVAAGNLTYSDLMQTPAADILPGEATKSQTLLTNDVELRIYRHNTSTGEVVYIGRFKFSDTPGYKPVDVSEWGTKEISSALVVNMDLWMRDLMSADPSYAETKVENLQLVGNTMQHVPPFRAKINTSHIKGNGSITWLPLDANKEVFATFSDHYKSVMEAENISTRFRYYVCLASSDAPFESNLAPLATEDIGSVKKLSNYANVFVPKREIHAGFIPYTDAQIADDTDGSLPPNRYGIAIDVQNNLNVSGYEIYDHHLGKIARIDRFTTGHFEPAVYDLSLPEEKRTLDTAIKQTENFTAENYRGRVIINLPPELEGMMSEHLSAEIIYYSDGGTYSGNSYIMPQVNLPERPSASIVGFSASLASSFPDNAGRYKYRANISAQAHLPEGYQIHDFAFWVTEFATDDTEKRLIHHPTAPYVPDWLPLLAADDNQSDIKSYDYTFSHSQLATNNEFIRFNNDVRLYAVPTYENDMRADTSSPAYVVADTWGHFGVYASGGLSGVEDVAADCVEPEFYTLQGIKVSSADLVPGIYLRRIGSDTEKIIIR